MQNKYYTPDISDLFIGYECEIRIGSSAFYIMDMSENAEKPIEKKSDDIPTFLPYIIGQGYENITITRAISEISRDGIRTPYLTKEQIEAEGWVFLPDNSQEDWLEFRAQKKRLGVTPSEDAWNMVIYCPTVQKLLILMRYTNDFEEETFYDGQCKSINEFRKIIKWIKI